MRVALISDCYRPAINGVVVSIGLQIEALRLLGHEVDLYCPSYPQQITGELGVERLQSRPFPFHKSEQMAFPWPPRTLLKMWKTPYDIVHIQTPFFLGLIGMVMAVTRRLPRIFHHHTLWEEYVEYLPIPSGMTRAGSVALCRILANNCQGVISPSQRVKQRFSEQGVRVPITVVPTGIHSETFQGGSVFTEMGIGDEVCLYIGRLAHEKSIGVVLRVFAKIYQTRPTARLWLVGDGPARAALQEQCENLGIAEVTTFFGFVPRTTLKDFLASSKLFLFASESETQGLVLLEAQAGGVPVVAVRASGVDEAVHPGVTGFLTEPGDEDGQAKKALDLLSDSILREQFSRAAVEWSEGFNLEGMGRSLTALYQSVIERAQNGEK